MADRNAAAGAGLKPLAEVRSWLLAAVARRIDAEPSTLDPRERFSRYGVDSMKAAAITAELSAFLGRPLARTLLWDHPSIDAVVRHLTSPAAPGAAAVVPPPPRPGRGEPIAIIGMACRFPRAPDPAAYWHLLTEGIDAIREVPGSRWDIDRFYSADLSTPGAMTTRWGGFLDGVDLFDPQFFGISPREAVQMDPQQRLVLELAWEALEDAGIPAESVKGTPTAVFVGAMWSDYARLVAGASSYITQHTATGQDTSIIPARVSYTFGLQGPSVAVNTACSSSLMAIHLACQTLRSGDATLALAGGVNLILSPESTVAMSKFGAMAPDGRSKAFDARADGYVRGEGAGLLVLKPLSRALRDGDPVYCVIVGSAVNNDGFSNGLTAPNPQAQEDMLRAAYGRAGIPPAEIDYIETHGTGTLLGDPIEAGAIGRALGMSRPADRPLLLGSVKTNIGHLEAAAGIAGLIKVALAMRHERIPGNLHFHTPNPNIDFDAWHLAVQRGLTAWPSVGRPAVAGVSSFGFGGTNCHVVVKQWPGSASELLPLAADSLDALRDAARALRQRLESGTAETSHRDVCRMTAGAAAGPHRAALNVRSVPDLAAGLDLLIAGREAPGVVVGPPEPASRPRLVWVFSPHGGQWAGMGRQLMAEEPVFRAALDRCAAAIHREVGWDLFDELLADEAHSRLSDVAVTQPAIFAIQTALAALWRSWGVQPDAVIGHSMGEVAAAHAAGVLTLEDAARVICHRSRLLARTAGKGALAVLGLSAEATGAALAGRGDSLWIVAFNSPASTLVSGESEAVGALLSDLERDGVFCRHVRVDVAAHSPHMDPLLEELLAAIRDVSPLPGSAAMYSTVEGRVLPGEAFDASYWVRNLRRSVLFAQAVEDVLKDGPAMFLEIGPHPVLAPSLQQYEPLHPGAVSVVESLRRGEDERAAMLDGLGRLYVRGTAEPMWEAVHGLSRDEWPDAVESGSPDGSDSSASGSTQLLVLSAHSPDALNARIRGLADRVRRMPGLSLHDLCYTAAARRTPLPYRFATTAARRAELVDRLDAFSAGSSLRGSVAGSRSSSGPGLIAFVFSGDQALPVDAAAELFEREPAFRVALERCDVAIRRAAGRPLLQELAASGARAGVIPGDILSFAVQVALVALWRSWGWEPAAVVGHRAGHVAAAHVAGVLSLDDALSIICAGSLRDITPRSGSLPLYSTDAGSLVDGASLTAACRLSPAREPAHVPETAARLVADGYDSFVEIGGEPLLGTTALSLLRDAGRSGVAVSSVRGDEEPRRTLLAAVGALFCHGHDVSWDRLFSGGGRALSLGPYPWQRQRYWLDIAPAPASGSETVESREAADEPLERWLYRPVWHPRPDASHASVDEQPGRWLVLADRGGLGARLAGDLRRRGHDCVLAYAGSAPPDGTPVDVSDPESFKRLCREGPPSGTRWRGIVHLWTLDAPDLQGEQVDAAALMAAQMESCGVLPQLVRALAAGDPPPLWIVTRGAQPVASSSVVAAAQAPIWGAARSLTHEHQDMRCVLIDLEPGDADPLADLTGELSRNGDDQQVAFRAGSRWTPQLERVPGHLAADGNPVTFDAAATYLITGGLGALGQYVARWMVDRGARRLVLTGRSAPAGRAHEALEELRALGASVDHVRCDVSRADAVAELMASLGQREWPLKGVVHAAGVLDDGVLLQQNWERFERVLAPKLSGAWNLHSATLALDLDLFVLFSSSTALLGASGQSNYAAANAFLDALAHRRQGLRRPGLSVNWGTWAGLGMAARMSEVDRRRLSEIGFRPMAPARAIQALDRAVAGGAPQVAVLSIDWSRYLQRYSTPTGFLSALAREAPVARGSTPRGPSLAVQLSEVVAERRLAAVAEHVRRQVLTVLGAPAGLPLRDDQGLRDVGLDSLMALELKDRLQASVEQPLPTTLAFDYPTISAITEYLAREVLGLALAAAGSGSPRQAADQPTVEEDLTDEEAERLLAQELALISRAREGEAGA